MLADLVGWKVKLLVIQEINNQNRPFDTLNFQEIEGKDFVKFRASSFIFRELRGFLTYFYGTLSDFANLLIFIELFSTCGIFQFSFNLKKKFKIFTNFKNIAVIFYQVFPFVNLQIQ